MDITPNSPEMERNQPESCHHTLQIVRPNAHCAGMIDRPFWRQRIEAAWKEAPIVRLCAARRAGKTTLAGRKPRTTRNAGRRGFAWLFHAHKTLMS